MEHEIGVIECCGLIGIKSFVANDDNAGEIKMEIENAIDSYDPPDCDCEDGDCDCLKGPGIAIATTNESQNRRGMRKHLAGAGFTEVLTTLNPNSGNPITLWVKDLSEGKTPGVMDKPAPAPEPDTELMAALKAYVERNPNPHTRAARALVEAFKKQFPG